MVIKFVSIAESRAGSKPESPKSPKRSQSADSDQSVTEAASTKLVGGSPASSPEED